MSPERSQATSELRLKNHYQSDRQTHRKTPDEPSNHHQIKQCGDQRQCEKNNRQPRQHFRPARSAEIEVAIIDGHPQQKDFHQAPPASQPQVNELMNHFALCKIASVTCNASTFSLTS